MRPKTTEDSILLSKKPQAAAHLRGRYRGLGGKLNDRADLPVIVHNDVDSVQTKTSAQKRRNNLDLKSNNYLLEQQSPHRGYTSNNSRDFSLSQSMKVPQTMQYYTRFDAPKPNGKSLDVTTIQWRYSTGDKIPKLYSSHDVSMPDHD